MLDRCDNHYTTETDVKMCFKLYFTFLKIILINKALLTEIPLDLLKQKLTPEAFDTFDNTESFVFDYDKGECPRC